MKKTALKYYKNSCEIFNKFAHEEWAIFLDSNNFNNFVDIIAARPSKTFKTYNQITYINDADNTSLSLKNPLDLIKTHITENNKLNTNYFCKALGFIGYEFNQHCINLEKKLDNIIFPDLAFGIYEWIIITDHQRKTSELHTNFDSTNAIDLILQILNNPYVNEFIPLSIITPPKSNMNYHEYANKFNKIKQFITDGETYQINFAQRFASCIHGSSWELYKTLRNKNPAPYSAYFKISEGEILSFSPEKFITHEHNKVSTEPMKGTRARSSNFSLNKKSYISLRNSEKDRAENLMIVDLMRNDLGQVCKTGSITVPELFTIKTFKHIYQLISRVEGQLKTKSDIFKLIKAIFPGGSITGAPKRRSREIINLLEHNNRFIYCGSIGYIDNNFNCNFNIAIRTLLKTNNLNHDKNLYFWGGGGIVADSKCQNEYEESLTKVKIFLLSLSTK